MSEGVVTLHDADESTLSYIESLLKKNDLPWQDVRAKLGYFYIAHSDGETVGIGGIETYGTNGVLRSVVIEESARDEGFGRAICEALEMEATTKGIETLYLLTTTASDFFSYLGYEEIERSEAPTSIQKTSEFEDLCPETAVCMRKKL